MNAELTEKLKGLPAEEAISLLSEYIKAHPEDDEALTRRGIRYFGLGRRALAINDYLAALRINPHSMAREALKAANEILDYRNTDLINP